MSDSSYEIKISFPTNATEPERFFRTAARIIESYNSLDKALLSSISSSASSTLILEDIKKGSILVKLMRKIEGSDSTTVKFIDNARATVTRTISSSQASTPKEFIDEVNSEIEKSALVSGLTNGTFKGLSYGDLGEVVNQIASSTTELRDNEIAQINSNLNDDSVTLDIPREKALDLKELESSLTSSKIENTIRVILLIKKLDFFGKSQWTFNRGDEKILAKISDDSWLNRFHNREIPLLPGDALEVDMLEVAAYDIHGNQLSINREIVSVIKTIPKA
ncbi:hypothetical protein [Leptospira wolffii]|uniref:hypothetical protein n=1 Tax=Leptospira wolffii TaxID=409998 RepID=UPI0002DD7ACC|nr:hypothetical protein [Leptospira wolffii]EPG67400.1 hypothetical protein LEP1GSC061_2091 [Leptospira wolffii serovar Khorat str. Khorat-H2]